MDLTFINATVLQEQACRTVAHNLLNLPFESIALELTVEFIPDPDPAKHNEFAITEYTYDSTTAITKIAERAPNWPEPWTGVKFLQETFAHELGHALYAALPKARRVAIAQMFGADSDDELELQPPGSDWEDRYIEGIAETFKDAFLPRLYRRYANRTHHAIDYKDFPAFRSLWRQAAQEVGLTLPPGNIAVPTYTAQDLFTQGHPHLTESEGELFTGSYLPGTLDREGIWTTVYGTQGSGPPYHNSHLFGTAEPPSIWVKEGTFLGFSFELDPSYYIYPPYFLPEVLLSQYNDFSIQWRFFGYPNLTGFGSPIKIFDGQWATTLMPGKLVNEISEAEFAEPNWLLFRDARGTDPPPNKISGGITVSSAQFKRTRICKGVKYCGVRFQAQAAIVLTQEDPENDETNEALRQQIFYPWLPTLKFEQKGCAATPGAPIVLAEPELVPDALSESRRRLDHRVVGHHLEV